LELKPSVLPTELSHLNEMVTFFSQGFLEDKTKPEQLPDL
jgi:hypothetical protein